MAVRSGVVHSGLVEEIMRTIKLSKYIIGYGRERKRQNGSCLLEKGRSEEAKTVRNELMWMTFLPPEAMMASRSGLQPRAMSGSMTLQHAWSVLMSMTLDITKGCENVLGLGHHMWPH